MEGSLVAYKVFSNGSVLQASEINDNLMNQSVMVFSNSAARTAAITSPLEGMLTWLEDVNRYENWNGTAWVSPFGTTFLTSTSFTSATSVVVDNVFTSAYDVYKIIVSYSSGTSSEVSFNLRVGGVNDTVNNNDQLMVAESGSVAASRNAVSSATARIGKVESSGGVIDFTLSNPALASRTFGLSQSFDSSLSLRIFGTQHLATSAFDGFRIQMSSSTGNLRVYGMRK
jgi:hypothetical protein